MSNFNPEHRKWSRWKIYEEHSWRTLVSDYDISHDTYFNNSDICVEIIYRLWYHTMSLGYATWHKKAVLLMWFDSSPHAVKGNVKMRNSDIHLWTFNTFFHVYIYLYHVTLFTWWYNALDYTWAIWTLPFKDHVIKLNAEVLIVLSR